MAATPETSDYTSLQQRSRAVQNKSSIEKVPTLLPLVDGEHIESDDSTTICRMRLMDYLELVDATGRALRSDKRGAIDGSAAGILDRLGVDQTVWLENMAPRKQRAPLAIGPLAKVRAFAEATGRRWIAGQNVACALG
ncbi:MAG: transposase, partial [Alcanivorax sp.]|nr:transposase [Alcanivorax sp.]